MINSLSKKLLGIWLFLMLAFPSILMKEKMYLIILIIGGLIINSTLRKNHSINIKVLTSLVFILCVGIFFILYGFLNTGIFYPKIMEMYILTPLVAYIFSSIIKKKKDIDWLFEILIKTTIFIVIYDYIYILGRMGVIPEFLSFETEIAGSFVMTNGKIEARMTNQSSLMFLLPMLIVYFSLSYKKINSKKKYLYAFNIIVGTIVTLFSGRRALQVVVLVALLYSLVNLVKARFNYKNIAIFIGLCAGMVIAFISFDFHSFIKLLENISDTFLRAFDFTTGSGILRSEQMIELLKGWGEAPLIGFGLGAHPEYIRSTIAPWSYEMVYFSFLYQKGLLGTIFYFVMTYKLLIKIYRVSKIEKNTFRDQAIAINIASICFLLAGATNPLIFYLWFWVIVTCYYKRSNLA